MLSNLRSINTDLKNLKDDATKQDIYINELTRIKVEAKKHEIILHETAIYYKKRYNILNIPTGLITKLLTLPVILSIVEDYGWSHWVTLCMSVISAVLIWFNDYFKYEKNKGKSLHASYLYRTMSRKIHDFIIDYDGKNDVELVMIEKFLKEIRAELDHIVDLGVEIPTKIKKKKYDLDNTSGLDTNNQISVILHE